MEYSIEKRAMIVMKSGKRHITDGIARGLQYLCEFEN